MYKISWPVELPEARRNKAIYTLSVYRPVSASLPPGTAEDCTSTGVIDGTVSLNPTGNSDFSFEMTTSAGQTITRDDLVAQGNGSGWSFVGTVVYIRFSPKNGGTQSGLTITYADGSSEPYTMDNSSSFSISGDAIQVNMWNNNSGNGNAMGRWQIDVDNSGAVITGCSSTTGSNTEEEETTSATFNITGGAIIPSVPVNATLTVLGTAPDSAGYITTTITAGGVTSNPFGDASTTAGNLSGGENFDAGTVAAGSSISATASSYSTNGAPLLTEASAPANQNVLVLSNGDSVASLGHIPNFLNAYVDHSSHTLQLNDNQAIMLFELDTTNLGESAADFNDLAILVDMTPQ